jgi:hypothetical protein
MIKTYSTAVMLFASASLFASGGSIFSSSDKGEIRYITNNKRLPDVAYQHELRSSDAWKNFLANNGTWYVIFNEENARPHRAFGKPVPVFGMSPENKALSFINSKLSAFHIPVSELSYRNATVSDHFQYVHFDQVHNGIKVLNSDLYVKITPAGEVISFGCDVFSDITISTSPSISSSAAITAASTGLVDPVTSTSVNPSLYILPVPEFKQNIYKLVYEVTVKTMSSTSLPSIYRTLVDAATGTVVSRINQVKHAEAPAPAPAAIDITITGTVYPTHPYAPASTMPLRNLEMDEAGTTYYTDNMGYVGLNTAAATPVTFTLQGLWSHVYTNGVTPSFTTTVNPGTNNVSFDSDANIRELSAYYHVNIVHDYMKSKFPSFTGLDNPLETNVDLTGGTCNAFYDGSSINFYALGGGCNSMAQVGDVVYHEYGHGINDKFYQSQSAFFQNGAMGEGYADIWALGITNTPVLGTGMDAADPAVFVRRYDVNKKVYPQDLIGEVHADGEIIAGAWWDTNLNFGDLQQMMDLYKETFYATVTGPDGTEGSVFVDVLIEALTSDDIPANGGDNDITNGTPNDNDIVDAFALHGITLLSNAVVTHTAVASSLSGTAIPITANVTVTYPWALAAAKVFYKINRFGPWTGIAMTNTSGTTYSTTIPPQPIGTVIGYYIGLEEGTGILSAVQPVSAHLTNPNIPYFILNGVQQISQEDFDDNFGPWGLGEPTDNATTGLWSVDIPVGSYFTPGDPSTVVQPGSQTTTGGQYCAVTGNAPSTSSALGTNDVDGGITTLLSPVYNLSSFTNPIFTYNRWYINNPPSGANPGNDSWEVHISDNGTTWTKIERTNVSDKSWRRYAFRVKDYVTLTSNVQVKFIAADSLIPGANLNGGSLVEAALDDMILYEEGAVGVEENIAVSSMRVYPNPASSSVNVSYNLVKEEELTVILTNALGEVVYTKKINSSAGEHSLKIDTNELAGGLYMLNLRTSKKDHLRKITVIK